jgi:hypothetical protein
LVYLEHEDEKRLGKKEEEEEEAEGNRTGSIRP